MFHFSVNVNKNYTTKQTKVVRVEIKMKMLYYNGYKVIYLNLLIIWLKSSLWPIIAHRKISIRTTPFFIWIISCLAVRLVVAEAHKWYFGLSK